MKHNLRFFLLAALMSMACIAASAHQFEVDGIYYVYNNGSSGTSVSVTYKGSDYTLGSYSGDVFIPETVDYNGNTYSVTSINPNAFYECYKLTSVTIPNSVTTINRDAFAFCSGLTSITIPNGVTTIEADAFRHCNRLTTVTIGNGVTSIGDYAFRNCSSLASVTIPKNLTSISDYAFINCSGLTSINVEIGNSTYDSRNNSNAIIETSTNSLIVGCKNTIIPNSVTSLRFAFTGCSNLTSITIPNSVTNIYPYAFNGCSGLNSIVVENGNTVYDSRNNCNAIIETASNILTAGCKNTIIPNSVIYIGDYAFYGCSTMNSLILPNSVTRIGSHAFGGCIGLPSVTIPNSVTYIGIEAFRNCSGLTSVIIGNSVTTIDSDAFESCCNLTSVTIPNSVIHVGKNVFIETAWYSNQPDGLIYVGRAAYKYKGTMPENTNIIIHEGTVSISPEAFYQCSGLTSVTIPNSVTSIGSSAFDGCSGLTSVTIPNSVTSIRSYAFRGCSGLTSVTIPNSVTSIGSDAFSYCSSLTSVTVGKRVPISIGSGTFSNRFNATLYVPRGSKAAYQAANYWKEFKLILEYGKYEQTMHLSVIPAMTYGDETYTLPQQTNEGLPLTWRIGNDGVATLSGNKLSILKAGTTTVTATQAGNDDYEAFEREYTLTINKAILTITANDCTKHVGENNPELTVRYEGFQYDDDISSLTTQPIVTTTATKDSPVGDYPITTSGAASDNYSFTYIEGTLTVVPVETEAISVSYAKIRTYCSEYDLDFTDVPEVKAYIASGFSPSTGDLLLTRVYKVPAGVGLILKAEEGEYEIPHTVTDMYYANLLVGVLTPTTISPTEGGYTNYILSGSGIHGIGFYTLSETGEIGANKAYLRVPNKDAGARMKKLIFEDEEGFGDEAAGIETIRENTNETFVFDLQGRRIQQPTRGIYIINGKKVIIK